MTPAMQPTSTDYGDGVEQYDCSWQIGQLGEVDKLTGEAFEWPMFSFERPAEIVWCAIAKNLHSRGWSDEQIKAWLQSKNTRWALDFNLGDAIAEACDKWATKEIGSFRNEMKGLPR